MTVFRYVCLEFAGSWLIRVDKNLKGRGTVVIDEVNIWAYFGVFRVQTPLNESVPVIKSYV